MLFKSYERFHNKFVAASEDGQICIFSLNGNLTVKIIKFLQGPPEMSFVTLFGDETSYIHNGSINDKI